MCGTVVIIGVMRTVTYWSMQFVEGDHGEIVTHATQRYIGMAQRAVLMMTRGSGV